MEQVELEELKLQTIHAELHSLKRLAREVQAEADQATRLVLSATSIDANDLAHLDGFREHVQAKLKKIGEQTSQCQQRADEQRKRLLEKRRQFELLDRLKKKVMAEWRLSQDKEQEELAAELFLAKRTRDHD